MGMARGVLLAEEVHDGLWVSLVQPDRGEVEEPGGEEGQETLTC